MSSRSKLRELLAAAEREVLGMKPKRRRSRRAVVGWCKACIQHKAIVDGYCVECRQLPLPFNTAGRRRG